MFKVRDLMIRLELEQAAGRGGGPDDDKLWAICQCSCTCSMCTNGLTGNGCGNSCTLCSKCTTYSCGSDSVHTVKPAEEGGNLLLLKDELRRLEREAQADSAR